MKYLIIQYSTLCIYTVALEHLKIEFYCYTYALNYGNQTTVYCIIFLNSQITHLSYPLAIVKKIKQN